MTDPSNGQMRTKMGVVYSIVADVILLIAVGIQCWTTATVIDQGKSIAVSSAVLAVNSTRLSELELRGSRSLESYQKMNDTQVLEIQKRVEKIEQAILLLQPTPARLEALQNSVARIERLLETHTKESK